MIITPSQFSQKTEAKEDRDTHYIGNFGLGDRITKIRRKTKSRGHREERDSIDEMMMG